MEQVDVNVAEEQGVDTMGQDVDNLSTGKRMQGSAIVLGSHDCHGIAAAMVHFE